MPLPSSGALTMSDIVGEFGGDGSDFSDYYRGGAHVPDTAVNSGIPTSGQMDFADFYDAAAFSGTVNLDGHNVFHQAFAGANGVARIEFRTDGFVYETEGIGNVSQVDDATDWITPRPPGSPTWIRATRISGLDPNSGDALNTWLAMTSTRSWQNTASLTGQDFSSVLLIEIASDSGGSNVLDSANYSIRAQKN